MRHVRSLNDLRQFGIICLTGEADATITRHLCALTTEGLELWCKVFGMNAPQSYSASEPKDERWGVFAEPWNTETDGRKHVAIVMFPSWYSDLWEIFALFGLVRQGAKRIASMGGEVIAAMTDEDVARFDEYIRVGGFKPRWIKNGWEQDRNTHQMTGRTV